MQEIRCRLDDAWEDNHYSQHRQESNSIDACLSIEAQKLCIQTWMLGPATELIVIVTWIAFPQNEQEKNLFSNNFTFPSILADKKKLI